MKRRLTLTSEHLTELTSTDLAGIAGGQELPTLKYCPMTGVYPTIERSCPSVNDCIYIEHTPLCPTTL